MKRTIIKTITAVLLACLTFAAVKGRAMADECGICDIELQEYELSEDGEEIPYDDPKDRLLPFDAVSKRVYVVNHGSPVTVRVKLSEEDAPEGFLEGLEGMPEGWVLKDDGWFYYERKLDTGERVPVMDGFRLGDPYQETWELQPFRLEITAGAVLACPNQTGPSTGDGTDMRTWTCGIAAGVSGLAAAAFLKRRTDHA